MTEDPNKRKHTTQELLNLFHNTHLQKLVAAWINIGVFEKIDPKERVGERVAPPLAKGQMPVRIEITAKEALENEHKKFKGQADILRAIQKREKELGKMKDEELYAKGKIST